MNIDKPYFPWQEKNWTILQNQKEQGKLSHAFLFVGMEGIGKYFFAEQFAHFLLCQSLTDSKKACGVCRQCQLVSAGNHPDLITISPEEESQSIKIEQIRNLIDQVDKTPQIARYKVILIHPADAMNINAANALLKTLEEPASNTFLILVTHRLMALPATIRSRCQIIPFYPPKKELGMAWLEKQVEEKENLTLLLNLTDGAPLKVLKLIKEERLFFRKNLFKEFCQFLKGEMDLVELSTSWSKREIDQIIFSLRSWLFDLISLKQIEGVNDVINVDFNLALKAIAKGYSVKQLYVIYDELVKIQYWQGKKIALNPQLLLEGLLVKFSERRANAS